jgi:hypothetical protein
VFSCEIRLDQQARRLSIPYLTGSRDSWDLLAIAGHNVIFSSR